MQRVLTFDGGGVRGLFQARFIEQTSILMQHQGCIPSSQSRWLDWFGTIAGTSTGAILAGALAAGIDPTTLVNKYKEFGGQVFRGKRVAANLLVKQPWYNSDELRTLVSPLFGNLTLGDCSHRLLICSINATERKIHIFDSNKVADKSRLLLDVVLASAAAPVYFKPYRITGDSRLWLDGGLACNNPALIAIHQLGLEQALAQQIALLSIANGRTEGALPLSEFTDSSAITWSRKALDYSFRLSADLADMLLDGNSDSHVGLLDHYLRVDWSLRNDIELDDQTAAEDVLLSAADSASEAYQGKILKWITETE